MTISTHVLDTSTGRPAASLPVRLQRQEGASWTDIYRLQGYEDLELPDELPQEEQTRLLHEVLRDRDLNPHDVLDLADGVEAALLALPAIQEHIRVAWREEHELAAEEADEREED